MAAPICVARIGAAHGVRGAVKLWTFTEDPLAVQRYGPLSTKDGARQFEVTHARAAERSSGGLAIGPAESTGSNRAQRQAWLARPRISREEKVIAINSLSSQRTTQEN